MMCVLWFVIRKDAKDHFIPVIVYHDILPAGAVAAPGSYAVPADLLAKELDYLRDAGITPITFDDALRAMQHEGSLPQKPIIITFDDAIYHQIQYAFPLLEQHGARAVFFIPSGFIGKVGRLSWSDIRSLAHAGMEIGGHTKTHSHIRNLNGAALQDEISGDKQVIEREIGKSVDTFAYPFGEQSPAIDLTLASAGYRIARASDPSAPKQDKGIYIFGASVIDDSFYHFLSALKP
jgi:peptidoglycan/xylan/chitin deacetylase (PgdA/CDA1 family)